MEDLKNLISINTAARIKDFSSTTIYNAMLDGRLDTVKIDKLTFIVSNDKFDKLEKRQRGVKHKKNNENK